MIPEIPENVTKLNVEPRGKALETCSPLGGKGTALYLVSVSEPGNGFPQEGIWSVMRWQHAKDNSGRQIEGFSMDDGYPYASAPVFLGETIEDAEKWMDS